MKVYWPMAKVKNSTMDLYTEVSYPSLQDAINCIEKWSQSYILIEKWVDVYEDNERVEKVIIGFASKKRIKYRKAKVIAPSSSSIIANTLKDALTEEEQITYHLKELKAAKASVEKLHKRILFKDSSPKAFEAYNLMQKRVEEHEKALVDLHYYK